MLISGFLTTIGTLAGGWLKDRAEIKKATVKAKIKQIETTAGANRSADEIALKNMEKSWKDELILVVFIVPLILAFFPEYQTTIRDGFIAIDAMPEWYKVILAGIIATIYGLRWLIQPIMTVVMKRFAI